MRAALTPSLPDLSLLSPPPSLLSSLNQGPGPVSGMEDQGFYILTPTILGLILLALLGLVAKRVIQRRKGEGARLSFGEPSFPKSQRIQIPLTSRGHSGALDEQPGVWGTWHGAQWSGNGGGEERGLGPLVFSKHPHVSHCQTPGKQTAFSFLRLGGGAHGPLTPSSSLLPCGFTEKLSPDGSADWP